MINMFSISSFIGYGNKNHNLGYNANEVVAIRNYLSKSLQHLERFGKLKINYNKKEGCLIVFIESRIPQTADGMLKFYFHSDVDYTFDEEERQDFIIIEINCNNNACWDYTASIAVYPFYDENNEQSISVFDYESHYDPMVCDVFSCFRQEISLLRNKE